MSHIAKIRSRMVVKDYVLRALDDLGYKYRVGSLTIGGILAPRQKVDIKVAIGFLKSVGLRKSGQHFTVLANSDTVSRGKLNQFNEQVSQRYSYHAIRDKLEQQGFDLVTEEKQPDGTLNLVLRRAG
jgi:hypothetical protein